MIALEQYAGRWMEHADWTPQRRMDAMRLLDGVNALLEDLVAAGLKLRGNPKTGNLISGEIYGGFRPGDCPIGARGSSHKEGQGVDLFDPFGSLGAYLLARPTLLAKHGLYMEHPAATPTWCHLQTRQPRSGARIFNP